jgi:hypothetical protein
VERECGPYRFSWKPGDEQLGNLPPGFWVFVSGDGMPCQEAALRIQRHADGRYVFTGIVIAGPVPDPGEVTSQLLRQVKLGEIQASLFGPDGPFGEFDPARPPLHGGAPSPDAARWLADLAASHGQAAAGPSRGPGEETLRDFARTYQAELARHPHRAMTTAARAHSVSRATANRWAAACRRLGYLPAGQLGKESS